jgi:hypothetical protein
MAYDEELAHRVCELLAEEDGVTEKAMFAGSRFWLAATWPSASRIPPS